MSNSQSDSQSSSQEPSPNQTQKQDSAASGSGQIGWVRMFLWPLIAILVFAAFFLRDRLNHQSDGVRSPAVGKQFTAIKLTGLTANAEAIDAADLQGKVVVINFWGYWCRPCLAEFPELAKLSQELSQHRDFQFVSVACHAIPDKPAALKSKTLQFLEAKDYLGPVHWDARGVTRLQAAKLAGAEWIGYPTTVLLDRNGFVRGLWTGYSPTVIRQLRNEAAKLLNEGDAGSGQPNG